MVEGFPEVVEGFPEVTPLLAEVEVDMELLFLVVDAVVVALLDVVTLEFTTTGGVTATGTNLEPAGNATLGSGIGFVLPTGRARTGVGGGGAPCAGNTGTRLSWCMGCADFWIVTNDFVSKPCQAVPLNC